MVFNFTSPLWLICVTQVFCVAHNKKIPGNDRHVLYKFGFVLFIMWSISSRKWVPRPESLRAYMHFNISGQFGCRAQLRTSRVSWIDRVFVFVTSTPRKSLIVSRSKFSISSWYRCTRCSRMDPVWARCMCLGCRQIAHAQVNSPRFGNV
jgi:hypothetical protein